MSRRIAVFLRHGDYHQRPDTPSAHQPFALNPVGVAQARGAALLIAAMAKANGWAIHPVLHASNLLRAWQTADLIREGLGQIERVEGFDALAERGLGSAANLTVAEIEAVLHDDPRYDSPPRGWKSDSHYRVPLQGAESLMDAGVRVAAHVRTALAAMRGGGDVMGVFVGHGAAFRHAAHVLGAMEFDDLGAHSMFHATPVALEDRGEQPWRLAAGAWKVRAADDLDDPRNMD